MLGAVAGGFLGVRVVDGTFGLFAFVVAGAVVGWLAGTAAALRQERGDGG